MFGSLERGLDKVITMLTPSKRKGSTKEGPRKLRVGLPKHLAFFLQRDLEKFGYKLWTADVNVLATKSVAGITRMVT